MTAAEKIFAGMQLIKEGCAEYGLRDCHLCPFSKYCVDTDIVPPESWEVKIKKEA